MSSWNINKSSARYDFLRDLAQCQVDVAMFREALNWHEDGAAAEVGWSLFHLGKRRKEGNCRKKEECESLEARSQKYKMGTLCAGKHLVSLVVLSSHVDR